MTPEQAAKSILESLPSLDPEQYRLGHTKVRLRFTLSFLRPSRKRNPCVVYKNFREFRDIKTMFNKIGNFRWLVNKCETHFNEGT